MASCKNVSGPGLRAGVRVSALGMSEAGGGGPKPGFIWIPSQNSSGGLWAGSFSFKHMVSLHFLRLVALHRNINL